MSHGVELPDLFTKKEKDRKEVPVSQTEMILLQRVPELKVPGLSNQKIDGIKDGLRDVLENIKGLPDQNQKKICNLIAKILTILGRGTEENQNKKFHFHSETLKSR